MPAAGSHSLDSIETKNARLHFRSRALNSGMPYSSATVKGFMSGAAPHPALLHGKQNDGIPVLRCKGEYDSFIICGTIHIVLIQYYVDI